MNGPTESETGHDIACSVCSEPMPFDSMSNLRHDDNLGYLCADCQWRVRIAVAHLKENGMEGCQYKPEPKD